MKSLAILLHFLLLTSASWDFTLKSKTNKNKKLQVIEIFFSNIKTCESHQAKYIIKNGMLKVRFNHSFYSDQT